MASRWNEREFVETVAARYGCDITRRRGDGDWDLRATTQGLDWHCRLRPYTTDVPPSIVWRTPSVRFDEQRPVALTISRAGQGTDGGGWDVMAGGVAGVVASAAILGLGFLRRKQKTDRTEVVPPPSALGPGWNLNDPGAIVDAGIAQLVTTCPPAHTGHDVGPAWIDHAWLSNDGLEVTSSGWWDSAPALDHQITLGLALAHRIRRVRGY